MKPHEETWTVEEVQSVSNDVFFGENDYARAKLAACAPEVARMLLEYEWLPDGNFASCGSCHGLRPEDAAFLRGRGWEPGKGGFTETTKFHDGHGPDCAWLALMRKAGVR